MNAQNTKMHEQILPHNATNSVTTLDCQNKTRLQKKNWLLGI